MRPLGRSRLARPDPDGVKNDHFSIEENSHSEWLSFHFHGIGVDASANTYGIKRVENSQ